MTVEQTLEIAVKHHQSGQLREAEDLYHQILREVPQHAGVLNLLGVVALQTGNYDLSSKYLNEALRLNSNFADAHNHLGIALKEQGRLDEAVASHRRALSINPNLAAAYINLGNALKQQGKLAEAIDSYQQTLRINPDAMDAYVNLGDALTEQGKPGEAVGFLQQAMRLNPNVPETHNNLGNALKDLGRLGEAADCYQQALRLRPNYAEAFNNLGTVLQDQGKLAEAADCLREALRLRPDFAKAHNNLGIVLGLQKQPAEAEKTYREAVRLQPNFAEAHYNLGYILHQQGKLDEALASIEQALRLRPDYPEARSHWGVLCLLKGDFVKGWPAYEWRWKTKPMAPYQRQFLQPPWYGNPMPGGTILLYAEQGFGDALQFIRFVPIVKERVGRVLVECPPELRRILSSCPGVDGIVPSDSPPPPFDVQASLMSLPLILWTTLATIPARIPYLFPSPGLVQHWKQELSGLSRIQGRHRLARQSQELEPASKGHGPDSLRSLDPVRAPGQTARRSALQSAKGVRHRTDCRAERPILRDRSGQPGQRFHGHRRRDEESRPGGERGLRARAPGRGTGRAGVDPSALRS